MNTSALREERQFDRNCPAKAFVYRHIVSFEETNAIGNVYYTRHVAWQGRCRELFLHEHVPEILEELERGLCLATIRCSCNYFAEVMAFDEVSVCMRLGEIRQNRMSMLFEYWRLTPRDDELVARGEQQVAVMRRVGGRTEPAPIPPALMRALRPYTLT